MEDNIKYANACKGINNLPMKEKIRMPVFANAILSNPHGFDKNFVNPLART